MSSWAEDRTDTMLRELHQSGERARAVADRTRVLNNEAQASRMEAHELWEEMLNCALLLLDVAAEDKLPIAEPAIAEWRKQVADLRVSRAPLRERFVSGDKLCRAVAGDVSRHAGYPKPPRVREGLELVHGIALKIRYLATGGGLR